METPSIRTSSTTFERLGGAVWGPIVMAVVGALTLGAVVGGSDPLIAVLGVVFLVMVAAVVVKPEVATVVVTVYLYVNFSVVMIRNGVPTAIASAPFLGLALPIAIYLRRGQTIRLDPIFGLMGAYFSIMLMSTALSEDPTASFGNLRNFVVEGLILYILFLNALRTPEILHKVIWALILSGVIMGGLSLWQTATGTFDNDYWGLAQAKASEVSVGQEDVFGEAPTARRLAGPIGSKNRYGQIMVVLLPIAMMQAWAEKNRALKLLASAACVPIVAGALLTYSRGSGIAIAALIVAMVMLRIVKVRSFLMVSVVILVGVLLLFPGYIYRLSTSLGVYELVSGDVTEADGSVRGRATENLGALLIFSRHPLFGVGPGQTPLYMRAAANEIGFRHLTTDRRAHSLYLEELADTGIIGFAGFMAIVGYTMRELWKSMRHWRLRDPKIYYITTGIFLALLGYLLTGIFLHLAYARYYWFLIALGGAAIQMYGIRRGEAAQDARPSHKEMLLPIS